MSDGSGQFPVILWRTDLSGVTTMDAVPAGSKEYPGGQATLSVVPGMSLTREQLKKTGEIYQANEVEWKFLAAAYDGTRALADGGYVKQHERESYDNYTRRLSELYGFGYTKSIVDLLTFYLFNRDGRRDVGELEEYDAWQDFLEDCDLDGTAFNTYVLERARQASIYGHVGILVDQSKTQFENREQQVKAKVYPYLATYLPLSILDWEYRKDENGRPHLEYLKLKDDDGTYHLWWRGAWEVWIEATDQTQPGQPASQPKARKIAEGTYPLTDIPFVWLYCLRTGTRGLGLSDVHDVARIDTSIIRNLSQAEEVTNYSAFPMLIEASQPVTIRASGETVSGAPPPNVDVGPRAVLTKDPTLPGSAPEWLEPPAGVDGILALIERKIAEIYRASNAGGMASTELSTAAKSGAALRAEFQLLGAKLASKSINVERAEKDIVWYWLAWQLMEDEYWDEVKIERPRKFDVEDLAMDLENMLTSSAIVQSRTFTNELQKAVVRRMLPAAPTALYATCDDEIDAAPDFAFRHQGPIAYTPTEQEDLELRQQEAEVEKAEKSVEEKPESETWGAGGAEEAANATQSQEQRFTTKQGSPSAPAPPFAKKGVPQ